MKEYISTQRNWYCGELEVQEKGSDNRYTLTQRKTLANEDFFCIYRSVAVPHQDEDPEYPYIYEISWMGPGTVLHIKFVDEETMVDFYKNFALDILRGHIYESKVTGWFKGREVA